MINEFVGVKILECEVNEYLTSNSDRDYFDKNNRKLFSYISVGVQSVSHPLFQKLPVLISNHLTPEEFFRKEFPDVDANIPQSVISFVFHFNSDIVADNAKEKAHPSYSWYETRDKFEKIIEPFSDYIKSIFSDYRVMRPYKNGLYTTKTNNKIMTANWSERHVAYVCGLGSFGLHGALITDKGCTHRLLSYVTDYQFEKYPEPPTDPYFNCLYFTKQSCGKCIERCPVGAIIPGEHIIPKCYGHEMITNKQKSKEIFGEEIAACGLCMSGVPCSLRKPI